METITVTDPVNRTEGQLQVKITLDRSTSQARIVNARCISAGLREVGSSTREIREDDNSPQAEMGCTAYPVSHTHAAVLALEDAANWLPSTNTRLLRNLTLGTTFLQAHILHFYLFAALDYVNSPMALPWKPQWQQDIRPGLDRVAANLPAALGARRRAHEMGRIFGAKSSGMTSFPSEGFRIIPTAQEIDLYHHHLTLLTEFIETTYLPDVHLIGTAYDDYFTVGSGCRNLIAFGAFEMDDAHRYHLFKGGYIENASPDVRPPIADRFMQNSIPAARKSPAKSSVQTIRQDSCLQENPLFEGGPLARMWINGEYQRTISVMDRHVARALEAAKIAAAMGEWLDELTPGVSAYDDSFGQQSLSGSGIGLTEAPCGPVGRLIKIYDGKISVSQKITPTCRSNRPVSPLEEALVGTVIENPEHPIEALRVIHSYDPCLAYSG